MRFYSRLFITLMLIMLAACNFPATVQPPTQGALVPTRNPDVVAEAALNATTTSDEIIALAAASATAEAEQSATATDTPTSTATDTPDASPTNTATQTPTLTRTPSITPTPTNTDDPSPTPSETPTITPTPAPTPIPQSLNYGDSASGEITSETYQYIYIFEGQEGDLVNIGMSSTSGRLDPLLILVGPDGVTLIENDDDPSRQTRDSLISAFALPASGTYTIIATRYQGVNGSSVGTFDVTLDITRDVSLTWNPAETFEPITLDEPVEGEVDNDNYFAAYAFEGTEGQIVDIVMENSGGDLDPQLLVLAPDGREIARNDDASSNNFDSEIEGLTLPETGVYTIVASRYLQQFGFDGGEFELTITESDEDLSRAVIVAQHLEYDSTAEGTIGGRNPYQQIFTFTGGAGDVVTIVMAATSGDLDAALMLTTNTGREIVRNEDDYGGGGFDSVLESIVLPADGAYTIVATRYQNATGVTEGDFELELALESAGNGVVSLLYGQLNRTLSGTISDDGEIYTDYVVGDLVSNNRDRAVQAVLTFTLPTLSEGQTIASAELDLSLCSEIGEGFDGFGDLTVYIDPFDDLQDADAEPSSDAEEIDSIGDCDSVDITDIVLEAYEEDELQIQMRLGFDGVERNEQADLVLFDPRLEINLQP